MQHSRLAASRPGFRWAVLVGVAAFALPRPVSYGAAEELAAASAGRDEESEEELYARDGPGLTDPAIFREGYRGFLFPPAVEETISWLPPARSGDGSDQAAWGAANRGLSAEVRFTPTGLVLTSLPTPDGTGQPWTMTVRTVALGRWPQRGWRLSPGHLVPSGRRVDSDRGAVREWFENVPEGVEAGLEVAVKPESGPEGSGGSAGSRLLALELEIMGAGRIRKGPAPGTVAISAGGEDGALRLSLGEFRDSRGGRVPVRFDLVEGSADPARIQILVDDFQAVYPLCGTWFLHRPTSAAPALADRLAEEFAAGGIGEPPEAAARRQDSLRLDRTLPFDTIPAGAYRRAREQWEELPHADEGNPRLAQQSVLGNRWFNIGPAPLTDSQGINASGRIRALAYDPRDPSRQTIYIGAATGGVWKTTDGGYHWRPLTDSQPSLGIQTLALDPQDPGIVYAGTGEQVPGAGILRSPDGGATWDVLGEETFDWQAGGEEITKIVLIPGTVADPLTQRTIVAGGKGGVYWSGDGGGSWATLFEDSGYSDLAVDPRAPATVFLARGGKGIYKSTQSGKPGSWTGPLVDANGSLPAQGFGRINLWFHDAPTPVLFAAMQNSARGREFKGIWKSSDGGEHWTRVTGLPREFDRQSYAPPDLFETESNDTWNTATPLGLGQVVQGQIQSAGDVDFYRIVLTGQLLTAEVMASRAGSTLDPVLKLYDAAGHLVLWKGRPLESSGSMAPASRDERITMDGWVVLSPGTYYLAVSNAGGSFFLTGQYQLSVTGTDVGCQCEYDLAIAVDPGDPNIIYLGLVRLLRSSDGGVNWSDRLGHPPSVIHQDIHCAAFEPGRPQSMIWGSDGGFYKTEDRGDTWLNLNQDLSITQIYPGMAQHPTDPDFLLVGTQDNCSGRFLGGPWQLLGSGDGGCMAVADSQTWYISAQAMSIEKTTDGGLTFTSAVRGLDRNRVLWDSPFLMDPNDSDVLIAAGGIRVGEDDEWKVYRTTDGAANWSANSQDLQGQIRSLAIAPSDSATAYAGTVTGRVWRTRDRGATDWTDVTPAELAYRSITDLAVDPLDRDRVYATVGGWSYGREEHVFRSTDGGATWTDISSAPWSSTPLPDVPANALAIDPVYRDTLFVATDYGLYRTIDAGRHWETFDFGLPKAAWLTDLVLNTSARPEGVMRVSTYGRGVWELRLGNDACQNAQVITEGAWPGTLRGASADGSTTCATTGAPDAWFSYTASCDGEVAIETCGSGFDTVLSIHDPYCPAGAGNQLDCNNECGAGDCGGGASCLSRTVRAGETTLIRVAGAAGATGDFTLTVRCHAPNDACDQAIGLYVPSLALGGTRGAGVDGAATCAEIEDTAPGVWFTVVGTGNTITASTCGAGTTFDSKLSVYCAGCGGQQCVAANDDACGTQAEVSWCSAPGRIYHLLLHGWNDAAGRFQLALSDGADCGPFYPVCAPGNDTCAAATAIGLGLTPGDTTGAGTDATASCASSGADVWYSYTPVCHGFALLDTCQAAGTLADTVLSVHESCGGREITCSDDSCGARSQVHLTLTADAPVPIRVAGYGGAQGTFPLNLDFTAAPLAVPPPGLYAVDGSGATEDHLLRFDVVTLGVADVGPTGRADLAGLAYAANTGQLYAIDDGLADHTLVTLNPLTGAATPFATTAFDGVRSLAYDVNRNRLFAVDASLDQLVEFNPHSGSGRTIGLIGFGGVTGLAYDPQTDTLYGSDLVTDQLIVIDPETGNGTAVGPFGGTFDQVDGLAFDAQSGTLYGIQNDAALAQARIVRIDTVNGAATLVGRSSALLGGDGLEFVPGLPAVGASRPYAGRIPVAGGCPFYRFTDYSGLPSGLSGDSEGFITGMTTEVGSFAVQFVISDSDITTPAIHGSLPLHVKPQNDLCAEALPVGDGVVAFTTVNAVTDGPEEPASCSQYGDSQVGSDIWFRYLASCTGTLSASLCGSGYDTRLAVYDGWICPAPSPPLACNDDACGAQSQLSLPATAGQDYLIRVGGFFDARGTGQLSLTCDGAPAGGCCIGGACLITTTSACQDQGGAFRGEGSDCTPDGDGDGLPDDCDGCPGDAQKTTPGSCGCGVRDQDADGDGLVDCLDGDLDGDGVPNGDDPAPGDRFRCQDQDADGCDDCSAGSADPAHDGPDEDGDGYCATGDCLDADPSSWRTPGDARLLILTPPGALAWQVPADPGCLASTLRFDVLRSTQPDSFQGGVCLESDGADLNATDPEDPRPGAAFYYQVRAVNPCGDGPLGVGSDGTPRPGRPCP